MKYVTEMIPCTTNHVCVFENGDEYEVIGWAVKDEGNNTKVRNGDVERVSNVSGMIAKDDEIRLVEDLRGFKNYANRPNQKEKSKSQSIGDVNGIMANV